MICSARQLGQGLFSSATTYDALFESEKALTGHMRLSLTQPIKYKGRYVEGPHPRDSNVEESKASRYWGENFIDRKAKLSKAVEAINKRKANGSALVVPKILAFNITNCYFIYFIISLYKLNTQHQWFYFIIQHIKIIYPLQ